MKPLAAAAAVSFALPRPRLIAALLHPPRSKGGQDRMVIELANYFELAANAIVGPANVAQFLHDLTYC